MRSPDCSGREGVHCHVTGDEHLAAEIINEFVESLAVNQAHAPDLRAGRNSTTTHRRRSLAAQTLTAAR